MTGSLNQSIHAQADADFAAQKKWRSFAFGHSIPAYSLYIFFRSRGFASRYFLHFVTYCVELYGIALFADTDVFASASHVTAAFFVINLINYGGVLFYRSQLLNRAQTTIQSVIRRSLFLSLPLLAISFYVSKSDFTHFSHSLLILLVCLRLVDQLCELGVMVWTADLQVRCRVFFPFWINFVFLGLVFANASLSVYVLESVYALVLGTFVMRLCHVGYYYLQARKTRSAVYFSEPASVLGSHEKESNGNFYFSILVVLSPIILPMAVTVYTSASQSEKLLTWILQIVVAAFVIRPFTSIMVDIFQKLQSEKFSEMRRLTTMSSSLAWMCVGMVVLGTGFLASKSDFSLSLVAWCVLALVSKIVIYRSFLVGKESRIYAPVLVCKYMFPLFLYSNALLTDENLWHVHAVVELCFLIWIMVAVNLKQILSDFKHRAFSVTTGQKLLLLNLAVSLKTLILIRRFRNALGQNQDVFLLNRRCAILSIQATQGDTVTKHLLMRMANWIARVSYLRSREDLSKMLGLPSTVLPSSSLGLALKAKTENISFSIGSLLAAKYGQVGGIEVWHKGGDEIWRQLGEASRPSLALCENIHQIAHHNLMTKNVSARHYRLFDNPGAFYYVVKNLEVPILIVFSKQKNLELSKECRDISNWLMFRELSRAFPETQAMTETVIAKVAA